VTNEMNKFYINGSVHRDLIEAQDVVCD